MKVLFALAFLAAASRLPGTEVRLAVVDDNRVPIVGAKTLIAFTTPVHGAEVRHEGLTDDRGVFSGSGRAVGSVFVLSEKISYYNARFERLPNDRDLDVTVVLPRIINPIPLLARKSTVFMTPRDGQLPRPEISAETIGFDFAKGEMVAPYGDGKIADILFKIHNEFKGWKYSDREMEESRRVPVNRNISERELRHLYGKFEAALEVSFPGAQEGFVEEKSHFLPYSRLKMPHRAPEEGYGPSWRYTANTYSPSTARDNVGFFLRTRVKLDKDGRIVSANFAKVVGDFQLDARGFVTFTYYFNPTPNDRNLEFDPKRNLFPATLRGADVRDP